MADAGGSGRMTPDQLKREEKKRQKQAKRLARKFGGRKNNTSAQREPTRVVLDN